LRTLGGELFSNGPATSGAMHSTFYNIGGYIKPSDRFNVPFSVGHTISGENHTVGYFGLYWAGGPAEKKDEGTSKPPDQPAKP
jgi:hypothetical protein